MKRKMWKHAITAAGQVSLPAEVRHRWGTAAVLIEDDGDRLVLRPVPEDALEGLTGILKESARGDISSATWRRSAPTSVAVSACSRR